MPTVHITLTDTPQGGVNATSDYTPGRGERCSLAQMAALEIITRTRADYGMQKAAPICPGCGSNSQVWRNQITGAMACHRVTCHGALEKPGGPA